MRQIIKMLLTVVYVLKCHCVTLERFCRSVLVLFIIFLRPNSQNCSITSWNHSSKLLIA